MKVMWGSPSISCPLLNVHPLSLGRNLIQLVLSFPYYFRQRLIFESNVLQLCDIRGIVAMASHRDRVEFPFASHEITWSSTSACFDYFTLLFL